MTVGGCYGFCGRFVAGRGWADTRVVITTTTFVKGREGERVRVGGGCGDWALLRCSSGGAS